MNAPTNTSAAIQPTPSNGARRKALTGVSIAVLIGLTWGGYEWYIGRHEESTDNAYVQGNVIQITPQIGGTVTAILADDTDFVKAGSPLVQLDPADAKVALDQAEANLGQAVRQVRTLYANNGMLSAQIGVRESDIAKAQTEIGRATDDLNRRQSLVGNGAVSKEELNHAQSQLANAQNALASAQAGVVTARAQLTSNQALTEGTRIESHPSVMAAAAKVREAYLALHRAALPAPVDGYVAKRTVQLGQRVAAGTPLMSIIPLNQLWVDANFKEIQLRNIRIGQPVTLTADVYGNKVEYKGTVAGMGAGTGAAFALLPAQNATGNWIKVVQRVPVRVALDPQQVAANPLRVGLSMEALVDVTDQSGKTLADAPRSTPSAQTQVYAALDDQAGAEVNRVIAANAGAAIKSAH
ncbi:HlyD family efflux transporter periplasmic adaptor subunit [Candidatus Aalborgicola defluviihabitans]|jgi:membrane fusion protein (multidrug efflux system)|uniref:HlyD family efflux transporter periplasmic adaptor subunit n=1 Tax=Candidatus Aalborgicola defluviihabitans TaxID=3386187 RepID=UPI001DDAB00C|nr:HlyD family efflux transporter periplasmic adaptor subunit [Burkholderiales bacterium]MBK6568764.1 HlyD family efflux transporter periplasmic adaptor subunit [Burkholderiales bacterium]MBK7281173.1 HlyD family efflux transporter periplasmic adaptor subunit [Burkholderiales bacterium]MBL0245122.1 HlyD family efflux transporter periplasmic adaptor subunit [Rhodoferax sp.]